LEDLSANSSRASPEQLTDEKKSIIDTSHVPRKEMLWEIIGWGCADEQSANKCKLCEYILKDKVEAQWSLVQLMQTKGKVMLQQMLL
jgi:hypothetical protein